jgi:hypothetical protein
MTTPANPDPHGGLPAPAARRGSEAARATGKGVVKSAPLLRIVLTHGCFTVSVVLAALATRLNTGISGMASAIMLTISVACIVVANLLAKRARLQMMPVLIFSGVLLLVYAMLVAMKITGHPLITFRA